MSEINVKLNDGPAAQVAVPITVAEALKKLDRDTAKQALAALVNGQEVDLAFTLDEQQNGEAIKIEPVLPESLAGLDVLRHSTAHLLAAAVLDLFPGTKLGIGPALLDDPRFGFFYDVIAPRPLTDDDLPAIERRMRELADLGLPFRREEVPKATAVRLFADRGEPLLHQRLSVRRLLPRATRAPHRSVARLRPDLAVRRLLEGRSAPAPDAAHLRHGVRDARGARHVDAPAGGGRAARPPASRPRARPVLDPRAVRRGPDLLASEGRHRPQGDGGLPAPAAPRARLRAGPHPSHRQARAVVGQRARGELRRLHVLAARVREDRVPAEADELSLPHRHLQVGAPVVSRPADPAGRARREDRKSTRLNSSHITISYAVFCL